LESVNPCLVLPKLFGPLEVMVSLPTFLIFILQQSSHELGGPGEVGPALLVPGLDGDLLLGVAAIGIEHGRYGFRSGNRRHCSLGAAGRGGE